MDKKEFTKKFNELFDKLEELKKQWLINHPAKYNLGDEFSLNRQLYDGELYFVTIDDVDVNSEGVIEYCCYEDYFNCEHDYGTLTEKQIDGLINEGFTYKPI